MIVAPRVRQRLLSGFAAAPLLMLAAPGGLAASGDASPAIVLTQDQTQTQHSAAPAEAAPNPAPAEAGPKTTPAEAAPNPAPAEAGPKTTPPAAKNPAPPPPKTPGPPPPKNLEPLVVTESAGVLGKKVIAPDGQDLGLVVDVVVDADGHPRAAVIDFGGFLGVGSRKIAVDWRLLSFAPGKPDWQLWLSLSRSEIQAAPEYKPDAATNQMVGPPWEAPASTDVHK